MNRLLNSACVTLIFVFVFALHHIDEKGVNLLQTVAKKVEFFLGGLSGDSVSKYCGLQHACSYMADFPVCHGGIIKDG